MPQGTRTPAEKEQFRWMLQHANLLYLGATVLVLMDLSYLSRFWTQFEAWCSMQRCTAHGLQKETGDKRYNIKFIHDATEQEEGQELITNGSLMPEDFWVKLSAPEIYVTNQKDKDSILPKIKEINEMVINLVAGHKRNISRV